VGVERHASSTAARRRNFASCERESAFKRRRM
jgi:hypothetical protein